jgi:imidazolonepropionase-like amidohydrolase
MVSQPTDGRQFLLTAAGAFADPWTEIRPAAILVDRSEGRILATGHRAVSRARQAPVPGAFVNGVLTAGLIDCHVHLVFSGDGSAGETTIPMSESELLDRALKHAREAFAAGVTTLADQGGPLSLSLAARGICDGSLVDYPNLIVSGPPITATREHMWYFGGETATDEDVSRLAERYIRSGVDFIKLVATGGGTYGSDEYSATLESSALQRAVGIVHKAGKIAAVHASSIEGIRRALEAGCDLIHHCNFYRPDGVRELDKGLARNIASRHVYVDPTLWVTESLGNALRSRADCGDKLAAQELQSTDSRWRAKRTDVVGLIEAGVRLVCGSDAGWQYAQFHETWREVVALANFGLSRRDALAAATVHAAAALKIDHMVGTLEPGKRADIACWPADPTADLDHLARPLAVIRAGVPARSTDLRDVVASTTELGRAQ